MSIETAESIYSGLPDMEAITLQRQSFSGTLDKQYNAKAGVYDESICHFRGVGSNLSLLFYF